MSARILVVDDILPNVKLLEAKLKAEYYDVLTATSGAEALEIAEKEKPDVILLDVMMPGMDGFEVCQRLKGNPETVHIPVVMVTALTDATDRVRGLEAGADDFLSKPVNDVALMSRVRSLVRLKMIVDEWQIRENTASHLGAMDKEKTMMAESVENAHVLILEDNSMENNKMSETLKKDNTKVVAVTLGEQAMEEARYKDFDLIVVSLNMTNEDGLRMCSFFRSNERSRSVPILMVGEEQDMERIARGLEIGAHDYILRPLDRNEFLARIRTQIRRKRYQDRLRTNYELSLSMALTDELTGLYNRRYLMVHLEKILAKHAIDKKPVTLLMMDIDFFKKVNDTHGHDVGDDVLKVFSERVNQGLRSFDMVARMGGEEFVAILPDAPLEIGMQVAERLRGMIGNKPIPSSGVEGGELSISVSIGGFVITEPGFDTNRALKEADEALYAAKEGGRNCSFFQKIGKVDPERLPKRKPVDDENSDTEENATHADASAPEQPQAGPPPSGAPSDPMASTAPAAPPSGDPYDPLASSAPQQSAQGPSGAPSDPMFEESTPAPQQQAPQAPTAPAPQAPPTQSAPPAESPNIAPPAPPAETPNVAPPAPAETPNVTAPTAPPPTPQQPEQPTTQTPATEPPNTAPPSGAPSDPVFETAEQDAPIPAPPPPSPAQDAPAFDEGFFGDPVPSAEQQAEKTDDEKEKKTDEDGNHSAQSSHHSS